jgi:ketosteroid isomerase-like protein
MFQPSKAAFILNLAMLCALLLDPVASRPAHAQDSKELTPFEGSTFPADWVVTEWNDLAKPAPASVKWTVEDGILHSGKERGTWLISQKEFSDFILEFEILLTERGNSGVALRTPMRGDPAFDGLELQFADVRYNPQAKDSELTGGIYRAIAPTQQVYQPTQWNSCRIELFGTCLKATINGQLVQDVDLSKFDQPVIRHDSSLAPAIKDRPRRGHIGFQHLSRNNEPVQIRKVRITEIAKTKNDLGHEAEVNESLRKQVEATERAFAKSMADRDFAAFQEFLADEAVFISNQKTLRGKRDVVQTWQVFFEGPTAPFAWEPRQVEVLASGKLALSTGPVVDSSGKPIALFTSIWRHESDGKWRIIFDRGGPAELPSDSK